MNSRLLLLLPAVTDSKLNSARTAGPEPDPKLPTLLATENPGNEYYAAQRTIAHPLYFFHV